MSDIPAEVDEEALRQPKSQLLNQQSLGIRVMPCALYPEDGICLTQPLYEPQSKLLKGGYIGD